MQKQCKKLALGIILIFLLVNLVSSQVPTLWLEDGIPLRQGYHIEWQRAGAKDDQGYVCYAWSDTRFGDRDVFAQRYAPDGTPMWAVEGAIVVQATVRQENPDLCSDENGGFIFTWVDYREEPHGDIWAQKLDADANPVWAPTGIAVCTIYDLDEELFRTPHTISDGQGGAIVVWHDHRSGDGGDIYAQHILSDGTIDPQWTVNGNMVAKYSGNQGGDAGQTVDTDGEGGVIIAWGDERASGNANIYASRITINGTLAWADSSGMPICIVSEEQKGVKLAPDGNGGAFMIWKDNRNYPASREDLYMQKVNHNGGIEFNANGIPLVTQNNNQNEPRIVYDGQNGAIFAWEDYRNDPMNDISDIYAQRINSQGQKQWGTEDLMLCNAPEDQYDARINSDGNGGAVAVWADDRAGNIPNSDIYLQRILPNGSLAWQTNGISINDEVYPKAKPLVRVQDDGSSFITWSDSKELTSSRILYQLYDPNGIPLFPTQGEIVISGIDGDAVHSRLIKISPAPIEKYLVVWQDMRLVDYGYFIYQQIFGLDGNIEFAENGKPVSIDYSNLNQMEGGQKLPEIVEDGAGGAFVVWEDHRIANYSTPQIYAQRIDQEGNCLWDSGGVRIMPREMIDQWEPKICGDGNTGAFIAWYGYKGFGQWAVKAYVAHLDANGITTDSVEITNTTDDETVYGLLADGSSGAIIYWRGGTFLTRYDLYAARVDYTCTPLWVNPICYADTMESALVGCLDNQGGAIFAWSDLRNRIDADLYAQKMDLNGTPQWTIDGVLVNGQPGDQTPTDIHIDSQGDVIIVLQDTRNGLNNDVYLQKLDGVTGTTLFQDTGLPVAVLSQGDQWEAKFLVDSSDGLNLAWEDYRSGEGSDLYAQHLNSDGSIYEDWSLNGDVVSDFFNRQINVVLIDDFQNGVVAIWEDGRSSGKSEILNLYRQRWNENPNGIIANNPLGLAWNFTLEQNYPNPFNPETIIRFNLKQAGKVSLRIFNALGQEVALLKDGLMPAGANLVVWDGLTSNGTKAASGIYYYRLEFNDEMKVMKMMVVR